MMVPILDEIIHDAAEGGVQHVMIAMAHRGRLNVLAHILQKPYSQILAEFKDPILAEPPARRSRLDGRREVSRRRPHRGAARRPAEAGHHLDAAQPEPPRSGGSGAERHGARRRDDRWTSPVAPIVDKGKVLAILIHGDAAFPGPGHRRRDAEPVAARGLRRRRHHPRHRQQPARVHDRSRGVVQHELRQRPGARLQDSDHARQRRRSGRVHRGGAAGHRLSPAIQARLPDRPGRLSQVRPQRRRRAGVHAAADLSDRRGASDRARAVRAGRSSRRARSRRTQVDALVQSRMTELEARLRVGQAGAGLRPAGARGAAKRRREEGADRRRRSTHLQAINAALMTVPEGFTVHRKLERGRERRKAMFAVAVGAIDRLGRGRRARDGDDPRRRRADPVHRRRRRARHVQPPPRGVSRCGERREAHPAAGAAAGEGVVRDPQQPAVRIRVRRLRARLQPAGAGAAGAVGSAVRRLHQRRADHPRRIPDLGPREVGHVAVAGAAAPPRLRRPGPRPFERAARAVPERRRRHQHAHRQLHDGGAVFPPAAPAGAAARRPIRCRSS